MNSPQIICFGEVLWDVFPDKKVLGGAPLNVAFRLHSLGAKVAMVSAVGMDKNGAEILERLERDRLSTTWIQQKEEWPTGEVLVELDSEGNATYEIKQPAAWDFIEPSEALLEMVKASQNFIFGSLVARGAYNRKSLDQLLGFGNRKIFDVNLRPPHYTNDLVYELMLRADVVKLNDEELDSLAKALGCNETLLNDQMTWLSRVTQTDTICVTKGKEGASLLMDGEFYHQRGFEVKVIDTVGAGDAFLAVLVHGLFLVEQSPARALERACAYGALVAAKPGASGAISPDEIEQILNRP